jgi:hypothetical protein
MNPAANKKWAAPMAIVRKNEYFESFRDGRRVWSRTDPERKAPVPTRSHCSGEN